ncbi:hypothetical protein HanRHA438_Chr16g0770091 [Helianthus annuus]|nr:hypothetical protein HanRHA438_Chr16g0770091 [Helianthus annuus]
MPIGFLVWVLILTEQGFSSYERSALHRRSPEKNFQVYRYYPVDREIYISYCEEWMCTRIMSNKYVRNPKTMFDESVMLMRIAG